ncbi:MAG: hypothetical protein KBA31_07735 [Alphaproteobacteria bacterium]|nr:hypothetical protein [Alphaproteobacteria bacterium]
MDAFIELGELLGRLSTAASFTAICTLLKQYAVGFGLSRVSFFDLRKPTPRIREAVICTDAPQALLRRLDRAGDFSSHPLVTRARGTREPFEISMSLGFGLKRTRDAQHPLPIPELNGLIVPVQEGHQVVAMATLTGLRPVLSPLARDALKLAVHAGWQRSKEVGSGAAGVNAFALTLREVECLRWVARGKTDQEVARILSVSARTVRFHVHNAKVKLNVATRIQAVTKLMRERPDLVSK